MLKEQEENMEKELRKYREVTYEQNENINK